MEGASIELIYVPLEGTILMLDDDGDYRTLTCVQGNGCTGCEFKRAAGKPQHPFCNAVACGDFERVDDNDVIFQEMKDKNQ